MRHVKVAMLTVAGALVAMPAYAEMKGNAEAIALADQMIESIGGKELWAKIKTLYIIEKSRTPGQGDGIVGEFWRDLTAPRETFTLKGRAFSFQRTWTAEGGWQVLNGAFRLKTKEEIAGEELPYWYGEIYVLYHQLASDDERLRLELGEDDRQFTVYLDETGRRLGDFWLNVDGDMYRWRHDDGTEYIYGPHRQFGDISFPDWGTQVNGSWSFYYVEVRGFTTPPPVTFGPPEGE